MSDLISLVQNSSPNVRNSFLISGNFVKPEQPFEKSEVVDSLTYNGDIKIEKTGKEIKEQIGSLKSSIETKKNEHYQNMMMYKKQTGIEPMQDMDDYDSKGFGDKITSVKIYGYDQKYPKQDNNVVYPPQKQGLTIEQKEAMEGYNHCARKYIQCSVDLIVLSTLSKNLSDNKKISLRPKQAALLGF